MEKKIISARVWLEIQQEARARSQRVRGSRKKIKAEAEELIRLIEDAPETKDAANGKPEKIVFTCTSNLGTKKWPDTYKSVQSWDICSEIKETAKRYTWGNTYVNKDAVLCYVAEEV